jgi:AcrR family transcriptional regulator
MQNGRDTVDVIVDGAIRALARHGASRLSMTDICREAEVSRGTLYRYFSNREEVLEAVNQKLVQAARTILDDAVAASPALDVRVRVVLKAMIGFPNTFPHMRSIFEYEPRTALTFLAREMAGVIDTLDAYLRPALEISLPVTQGAVTVEDVLEIFYRIITSSFLLPTAGSDTMDERLASLWESVAQPRRMPRARPRATTAH